MLLEDEDRNEMKWICRKYILKRILKREREREN